MDSKGKHSIALTGQGKSVVPSHLVRASADSGGSLHVLDEGGSDLLDRAGALREHARQADLIVFHLHPYDVVPLLALSTCRGRPPAIFMNHADHVFWVGLMVSDLVAHFRPSGDSLSRERRGVPSQRSAMLPVPLSSGGETTSRANARARLDLSSDAQVLLTVATSYKYAAKTGPALIDLLAPVLSQFNDCVVIAVGPRQEGDWERVNLRYPGRVRAVGVQEDIAPFFDAADIYLDSFPTTSVTSMLEAGQHGLPLLRYDPSQDEPATPLVPDDPALDGTLVTVSDPQAYRAVISAWLSKPTERSRVGSATKRSVNEHHCGAHWLARLELVYAQAKGASQGDARSTCEFGSVTNYDLALVELMGSAAVDLYFARRLLDYASVLPPVAGLLMLARFLFATRGDLLSALDHRRRISKSLTRRLRGALRTRASELRRIR